MTAHKLLAGTLAAVLLSPGFALAADAPLRKSGLWELRSETTVGGQAGAVPMTMQMCIDQSQDDITADPAMQDVRKHCTKMDVKRSGNTITIDSVCMHEGHTATGHTVITGSLATDYRMESTTRFDPPMHGMQTVSSTMTGKWLGPCKPGQTHGSVTLPGITPDAGFRLDPEMMKRMQQILQQGR